MSAKRTVTCFRSPSRAFGTGESFLPDRVGYKRDALLVERRAPPPIRRDYSRTLHKTWPWALRDGRIEDNGYQTSARIHCNMGQFLYYLPGISGISRLASMGKLPFPICGQSGFSSDGTPGFPGNPQFTGGGANVPSAGPSIFGGIEDR